MSRIESFQKKLSLCLLESPDTKSFVMRAFGIFLEAHPKANYADLARSMGFSSRSFVRQLALGKRSVTAANHQKIARGLRLSPEACEHFSMLVEKKNGESSVSFEKKFSQTELKLRKSLEKTVQRLRKTDPIPFERWPFVYAALGSASAGRSFKDIVQTSGQNPKVVDDILNHLVVQKFVIWNENKQKYFPKAELIDMGELGNSHILKSLYKHNAMEALRRVDTELANQSALFHSAVFSIRKHQMPSLVQDLQKILASYAASSEDSNGEQVVVLNASFLAMK